jgi:hypothetical protein
MVNLHRIQHLAINPDLKTLNPDIIIVANSKLNSNNNCENRIHLSKKRTCDYLGRHVPLGV